MPDHAAEETWPAIRSRLRERIPEGQYRTWFAPVSPGPAADGVLTLRVPNEYFREWLGRQYLTLIEDAAEAVLGRRPRVRLEVDATLLNAAAPPAARLEGLGSDLALNRDFTFENFVVGPSNRLACAAAQAVADQPGRAYNPLYIHGAVGLGKSHLLQAICHRLLAQAHGANVVYTSCEAFVNRFISAIQRGQLDRFRQMCRRADVLVIDDIQFLTRAERSQEEFFHTFNTLHNAQRQIVLSSDSEPDDLSTVEVRLTSRFKSGLVARLEPPTLETRVAIIHRKGELRGWDVPDDVVRFIAENHTSSIRELEGALVRVIGYASLTGSQITMDLARSALATPTRPAAPVSMQDILHRVSNYYQVPILDLQSKQRKRSVVLPRQVCMYLARNLTNLSLGEIGGYFGGRDHSTVLHATNKVREMERTDPGLAQHLNRLRLEIQREAQRGSR